MAESFSGCVVVGPDDILDVLLAVVGKIGFAWQVASENAVGIFNGAALPGRMWIAEEARHAKVAFQILVCGEFRAVVAGDGAPGDPRQAAEGLCQVNRIHYEFLVNRRWRLYGISMA